MKNRRRRESILSHPRFIFAFLCTICVTMLLISFIFGKELGPIKTVVDKVVFPMQDGINQVGTFTSKLFQKRRNIDTLEKENKTLQERIEELELTNKVNSQSMVELERLRKLLDLDKKFSDYKHTGARIIAKDQGNWYNQFYINKGSEHGIAINNNVLQGNNLVGIVTEVFPTKALITTIIDERSKVPGKFLNTSVLCSVSASDTVLDEGKIFVDKIDIEAKIKENDEIITSHISGKYLEGITIGYITNIRPGPNNLTQIGDLIPAVNFKQLDEVLVILELKETVDDTKYNN